MTSGTSQDAIRPGVQRWRYWWPILPLLVVIAIPILGVWELLRPDHLTATRFTHLLIAFLAVWLLAVTVLISEYFIRRALSAEAEISRERLRMSLMAAKAMLWERDINAGQSVCFGDLQSIFGITKDELVSPGTDLSGYIHPDERERVLNAVSNAQQSHKPYREEIRVIRDDGKIGWVMVAGEFHYDKHGKAERMLGMTVDITGRKLAEEALKKSEEKFAKAFRESPVAFTLTSAQDHRYLDVNDTFEKATGWRRDEVIGCTPMELGIWVNPVERTEYADRLRREGSVRNLELRYRCKDGTERVGLGSGELIEIGGELCALSAVVDITEHKQARDDLAHKEEELREAQRLAHLGSWQWDPKTGGITWSEELYRIHGLDPKVTLPPYENMPRFFTAESWSRLRATMERAVQTGSVETLELELIRPDSSRRWVVAQGEAVCNAAGEITLFRGTVQDITERKQAVIQLRESEERFRRVVEHISDAVIVDDVAGHVVFANDRFLELFGFRREQIADLKLEDYVSPEYRAELRDRHDRRMRGESVATHFEYAGMRADGERRWLEVDVVPVCDQSGKLIGTQSAIRDITERKFAEAALQESEQRYRHLVTSSNDWVWEVDAETVYTYVGPQCREILGYEPEEIVGKTPFDLMPADEAFRVADLFKAIATERKPFRGLENVNLRKDGRLVVLETNGAPIIDDEGRFYGYRGMDRDITERKRAEHVLRESEERFRLVANTAPVLIWMSGPDKLCTYFNHPWLEFTGRPLEAELGNGWAEGVHPDDLNGCMERYTTAFDRRESFKMEYRLRHHDGEYRWVFDTGVPRFSPDGSFVGYIGSCIDITNLKLAEEALANMGRKLIEAHEEERTWIARELHDDINQRIAMMAIELDQWKHQLPESPVDLHTHIRDARQHLSQIGKDIQALSHRLHSSKLEYLGITAAVNSFCKELSEQQNVTVEFSHSDVPHVLPKEVSLCLFRVLQEALQNAVKHSGARQFKVELRGARDEIRLTVADLGIGFDSNEAVNRQGLGLVSMRERLQLVKGRLFIESAPGRGTTIHACVPVKAEESGMSVAG